MSELFSQAQHYLSRDHHTWNFSADNPPALRVRPGEIIHVQTWDCYRGAVVNDADLIKTIKDSEVNPATGPIYIEGAEPGDTLSVRLIDIKPEKRGCARLYVGDGQLHDKVRAPYGKFFDVIDGVVRMDNRIFFPAVPMLGVIGLAPEIGSITTMPAGKHGGNLDNNENRIGSTIHLPVRHPGALLGMGDMHASMGDGEICGTGIEISGDVLIQVDLIKSFTNEYPVTETPDSWITYGVAVEDLDLALKIACEQAAHLLVTQWGFTYEDAFIFLSVTSDLGVAQAVHPCTGTVIAKMRVPKLAASPSPFNISQA